MDTASTQLYTRQFMSVILNLPKPQLQQEVALTKDSRVRVENRERDSSSACARGSRGFAARIPLFPFFFLYTPSNILEEK